MSAALQPPSHFGFFPPLDSVALPPAGVVFGAPQLIGQNSAVQSATGLSSWTGTSAPAPRPGGRPPPRHCPLPAGPAPVPGVGYGESGNQFCAEIQSTGPLLAGATGLRPEDFVLGTFWTLASPINLSR